MSCFWFPALLMPVASTLQVNSSTATVTRVTMAAGVKGNGSFEYLIKDCYCWSIDMSLSWQEYEADPKFTLDFMTSQTYPILRAYFHFLNITF